MHPRKKEREHYEIDDLVGANFTRDGAFRLPPRRRGPARREHAVEMGGDPDKNPPFFFTKPADAIVDASRPAVKIPYPPQTADLQHEVELVVALGKGAPPRSYLVC